MSGTQTKRAHHETIEPPHRSSLPLPPPSAASPALGRGALRPRSDPPAPRVAARIDAVIVGAGAAGIAAARRLTAAGRRFVLLEAGREVGGRCITDTTTFGVPYDRGAHWIYTCRTSIRWRSSRRQTGLDLYPAPPGQRVRIGRRYAREGEMEDFLAGARARHDRHRRCVAQERRRLRPGAAEGSRRLAPDHRVRARPVSPAART